MPTRGSTDCVERNPLAQRGSVLVEFAASALMLLTVMFGTLQLGVVGLEQIKADGAAYTGAHQNALGATGNGADTTLVPKTYPGVTADQISSAAQPLPSPVGIANTSTSVNTVPVDYDITNTVSRHGGVSLVQPTQIVETVLRPVAADLISDLTGSALTLSGIAVEPQYEEIGMHGDVASTAFNDIATFNARTNYFVNGENAPPYFVGFRYMLYCTSMAQPTSSADPPTCSGQSGNVFYTSLGIAEVLDTDNWGAAQNGVTAGSVFANLLMHQQVYAQITSDLVGFTVVPSPATVSASTLSSLANYLNPKSASAGALIQCVYSWDVIITNDVENAPITQDDIEPGNACSGS